MTSLWFVVPAHGRVELTRVCLRQLARTCATLTANGIRASAVVIADDDNLETAAEVGFATVERTNVPLGRKWNDGYELAGMAGVDFVVPFGTDDWIDPELLLTGGLPDDDQIRCCRLSAIVSEDRTRMTPLRINYEGGDGVRILPAALLKPLRFRPAEEDAARAIDTSVMRRVSNTLGNRPRLRYLDLHPWQIVDWKSDGGQLNTYDACLVHADGPEVDPFAQLTGVFPDEALAEMAALDDRAAVAA